MVIIRGRQMGDPLVFISAVRLGTMERIRVGPGLIDIIVSDAEAEVGGCSMPTPYAVHKKIKRQPWGFNQD